MRLRRLRSEVSCPGVQGQEFGLLNVGLVTQDMKYIPSTRWFCKEPSSDQRNHYSSIHSPT